jgi:hypothetical protein
VTLGDLPQPRLQGALLDQAPGLAGQVVNGSDLLGIGVADRHVELRQPFERVDMVAQLRRGRQDLPQALDVLVGFVEGLAHIGVDEATVNNALQAFVGVAAFAGIEVRCAYRIDLREKILQQEIEVLDHPADIFRVELQRLL